MVLIPRRLPLNAVLKRKKNEAARIMRRRLDIKRMQGASLNPRRGRLNDKPRMNFDVRKPRQHVSTAGPPRLTPEQRSARLDSLIRLSIQDAPP